MRKLWILLFVLPLIATGQEEKGTLMSFADFTIKTGHAAQFEDGAKKWKACYLENNGTEKWNMWQRVQGEGTVYSLVGYMENWAEMDQEDDAGKGCRAIVMNFIMPHVEKVKYSLHRSIPKWSQKTDEDEVKIAWETSFKIKDGQLFSEAVEEYIDMMSQMDEETEGYFSYTIGGGPDDADYTLVYFEESYAAMDIDEDSSIEKYEKAQGKEKADEMRDKMKKMSEKWQEAVEDSWSYMWEHKPELSN